MIEGISLRNEPTTNATKQEATIKNTLLYLLSFTLLSIPLAATAQQYGDFTYTSDGSAITITAYTGSGGGVIIPDTINGLPVTAIGYAAFFNKPSLTSITIPRRVANIAEKAFGYGLSLTAITVDAANASYSSLDGVLFDKRKTFLIEYPGGKGGNYSIPGSVTSIGEQAFDNCTSLTGVTIPGSVTSIGDQAFDSCTSLANVTISGNVTNLGYRVFSGCRSLTTVTIPGSVTSIGREAFFGCISLTSVTISNGVTTLEDYAFWTCPSLTSVTIPGSVASLGLQTFSDCTGLTSVTILGSLSYIGQFAFENCRNLQAVFIKGNPPGGLNPFQGATNAIVYYLPGTTGWSATFAGRPTRLWNPLMQTSGVGPAGFGFNIVGTTSIPIVIEAATSVLNANWVPLQSLNLTNGAFSFNDPNWTNYPGRFYRIRSP